MTSPAPPEKDDLFCRLGLSSSLDMRARSFGQIETDELLDYEGQRFHPSGLFSQRIFGCVKSWHCECGKYSPLAHDPAAGRQQFGLPYRTVCETCHVLLARNRERRKRFGHIALAAPILHPWLWGNSSRPVEVLLGLSTRELRQIMRGTRYVSFFPNAWHRELMLAAVVGHESHTATSGVPGWETGFPILVHLLKTIDLPALAERLQYELSAMPVAGVLSLQWHKLSRRLAIVHDLIRQNTNPIDFVLEVLPVIPAGLRKIRCNDRGTIRVDELTRRYQDILRHNNSIEKYIDDEEVLVPFRSHMSRLVSCLFEMLPGKFPYPLTNRVELPPRSKFNPASDTVKIRRLRRKPTRQPATAEAAYRYPGDFMPRHASQLPLRWKGNRVDFSAVSYIVPDASLQPQECGLPLDPIAWELFGPQVTGSIMRQNSFVHSIAQAFVTCRGELALEHLTKIMSQWPVVLSIPQARPANRVKAFVARPVQDKSVHLHPVTMQQLGLRATGETAKVFLPLSGLASREAMKMVSSTVDGTPAAHQPIHCWPTYAALVGCYLATQMEKGLLDPEMTSANTRNWRAFRSTEEIELAVELGKLNWTTPIVFEVPPWRGVMSEGDDLQYDDLKAQRILTTPGRVLLDLQIQAATPQLSNIPFYNRTMDRRTFENLHETFLKSGQRKELQHLVSLLDAWGAHRLTQSGLSLSAADMNLGKSKPKQVSEAFTQVAKTQQWYVRGAISQSELYNKVLDIWTHAREQTTNEFIDNLSAQPTQNVLSALLLAPADPQLQRIFILRQLMGMSGSVCRLDGRFFQAPVISNLREGLPATEYFMLLPGRRREALLKNERKSYLRALVRQLAPVLREVRVTATDCHSTQSIDKKALQNFYNGHELRHLCDSLVGRTSAEQVVDPITAGSLVDFNDLIGRQQAVRLEQNGFTSLRVRSPLACHEIRGVCSTCLGMHPQDAYLSVTGQAIGSQALLALADLLFQITPTIRFFGGYPRAVDQGELKATHQGTISFQNLNVAFDSQGVRRNISRKAKIAIHDWKARLLMEGEIPHGAEVHVENSQSVSAGTLLASWYPQAPNIYAHAYGTVQLVNLLPGQNVQAEILPQGDTLWKVTYDLGPQRPYLVLLDPVGTKLDYFFLPENTWVHVRDGQSVKPGMLLAATVILPKADPARSLSGLAGVTTSLRASNPRERAVLAQCHGKVEVSTLNPQGRCNILVHELTSRGKPTNDIYTHPVSPYQRVLVSSGDVVGIGQQLTSGPVSLDDVLRLCGRAEASNRLLMQVLHPLAIQWPSMDCQERLWELVVSRLFSEVEVVSPGSLQRIPGTVVEANLLQRENERLRQSMLVTEAGDSHFAPGSIQSQADFQAVCEQIKARNGKLPLGEKPRLAGFRPRLSGLASAAIRDTLPLLAQSRSFASSKLVQAALHGFFDEEDSLQTAMLTGKLILAGVTAR